MKRIMYLWPLFLLVFMLLFVPGFPVGAQAKQHNITLNWTASTTPNVKYNVGRATTAGGPYDMIQLNISGTTFVDNTGTASTKYFYVVDAVDASGFQSVHSNEATATFLVNPSPATGLQAVSN